MSVSFLVLVGFISLSNGGHTTEPCPPGSYPQQGNTFIVNNQCYQSLLTSAGQALTTGPCATNGFQQSIPSIKAYTVDKECFDFVWKSASNSQHPEASSADATEEESGFLLQRQSSTTNVEEEPPMNSAPAPSKRVSKYVVYLLNTTWHLAWNNCKSGKYELATVKNFEDQDELNEAIARSGSTSKYFWLGATEKPSTRNFQWVDSKSEGYEDFLFTSWQPGYPKARRPSCTSCGSCVQADSSSGHWINVPCQQYAHYICERKQ